MTKHSPVPADPKPKLDFSSKEYNAVAAGAQLMAIQQLRLVMDGSPNHYRPDGRLQLVTQRGLKSCYYEPESNSVAAIFQYTVTAKAGRTRAFKCVAEYAVLYEVPKGAPEDAAKAVCAKLGIFAAYPYFRAVAAQMAWNAGLELPPMPTIAAKPVLGKSKVVAYDEEANGE